jgi:probable HAF family extracellular repeat protein
VSQGNGNEDGPTVRSLGGEKNEKGADMKFRMWTGIGAMISLAALVSPVRLAAQEQQKHDAQAQYSVTRLGALGGTVSGASSINNRGWIAGFSNLSGDATQHATLWLNGSAVDLGTLGGPNSSVSWPVKNERGQIVGIAETAAKDPLGERWSCAAFFPSATGHTCLGFVWQNGVMTALPTLGGNNGYAAGANNRGQVVGWAENTNHDSTCVAPQVLQFRAALWGPKDGQVQELSPLPGDTTSAATAINDKGQVVGISGICDRAVGRFSAAHAVLWQNGTVTDIGNLGGVAWNTPAAINNQGQVAGFSDLPGDQSGAPNFHAFLWTKSGGIQDLGTLPGDFLSLAFGINDRGQVVGQSIGAGGSRAFLWQDGVMTDLNNLVPPGSLPLVYANDINSAGEIVGGAFDPSTGASPAFLASPNPGRR